MRVLGRVVSGLLAVLGLAAGVDGALRLSGGGTGGSLGTTGSALLTLGGFVLLVGGCALYPYGAGGSGRSHEVAVQHDEPQPAASARERHTAITRPRPPANGRPLSYGGPRASTHRPPPRVEQPPS